jgi:hypothetical protein
MEGAKRKAGIDAFFTPVAKKPFEQSAAAEAAVNTAPAAGPAPPLAEDDGLTVR